MVFGSGSDGGDGDRAQTTSAALEEEAELETSINAATFTTNDDPVSRHPHLLIQHHGFICKEYDVVTKDGFILTLQRIVVQGEESDEASNNTTSSTSGKASTSKEPVLLVHGLFQSSGVFLSNGKKSSLAFHLANLGYDVWLGNNRCVEKKHTTLTDSDPAFWDWSLDELARYDFPTMIDLVCRETVKALTHTPLQESRWMELYMLLFLLIIS